MVVIILCAGKGTRAREVTGNIPKSLYPLPRWTALGHLLNFVGKIDHKEVRIVINPADLEQFDRYCGWLNKIHFYEQPEPQGEADAVWCAIQDLRYQTTPLLILLGDKIPVEPGAGQLQKRLLTLDTNLIGISRRNNPRDTTVVLTKTAAAGYVPETQHVREFVEVRGDNRKEGLHLVRSGFDYIRRAELLYDAIRHQKFYNLTVRGEYRLTTAYQCLLNRGATFDTLNVDGLHLGDEKNIKKAIEHYEQV